MPLDFVHSPLKLFSGLVRNGTRRLPSISVPDKQRNQRRSSLDGVAKPASLERIISTGLSQISSVL